MAVVEKKSVHALRQNPSYDREDISIPQTLAWGIKQSYAEFSSIDIPKIMIPDQYKSHHKITTENYLCKGSSRYSFKEFCPIVFKDLRNRFGINEESYAHSLSASWVDEIVLSYHNPSNPHATTFYSDRNHQYLIKTVEKEEAKAFAKVFWNCYRDHMVEFYQDTLLPKYTGVYKTSYQGKLGVYLFARVLGTGEILPTERYVVRAAGLSPSREIDGCELQNVSKDCPLQRLKLSLESKGKFLKMLRNDLEFIRSAKLLTFALLINIYKNGYTPPECSGSWVVESADKNETYSFLLLPFSMVSGGLLRKEPGPKGFRIRKDSITGLKTEKDKDKKEEKKKVKIRIAENAAKNL
eukprot:Ihof_evm3s118 gene=Ihof_evmTU3s118